MTMMPPPHAQIAHILATVRRRWVLRRLLRGLIGFTVATGVIGLLAVLVMNGLHFAPAVVTGVRVGSYVLLAVAFGLFVGLPLVRRVTETRLALYVEEHEPSLAMALASAAELKHPVGQTLLPALERALLEQALDACHNVDNGRRVERPNLHRAGMQLALAVASLALLMVLLPANLRHGFKLLLLPNNTMVAANPYRLSVEPGDARVSQGADQLIVARVQGFEPDTVELISRFGPASAWRRAPMTVGAQAQAFETFLFDLRQSGEYYISAGGLRSPVYRIEVAELPSVRRVDLTYHYPAHARLPPQRVVGGGDISAVRGSRVDISITPSIAVAGGNLVLDGRESRPLDKQADGTLATSLELEREGHYRIDLAYGERLLVPASPNYAIEVLPDGAPTVRISVPARDTRVTSVEEPVVEVKATDDLGLGSVELLYSVNGAPEQTVRLHGDSERSRDMTAEHTLFLEELGLRPGDLIAYYARARDSAGTGGQQATTDLYFMEIRPFEQAFRQAQGGGAGAMGGSGAERSLSAQQRQFVIATFNLARDRDGYTQERFSETVELLLRAEERIRDRVEAIIRRLLNRSIIQLQEGYQRMAEELPKAVEAMRGAETALSERQPQAALAPAREALQHLQRAEAAFRDVNVARAGAAGGGNAATDAEDLANLFKLEMDKLRSQYESVQHGQQPSTAQALDKTLEQLRELARRQQQEIDRVRRRAELGNEVGGGASSQRALAEELEKIVRQLQRLTRERPTPELQATLRQAQQAADAMRRAASSGSKGSLADAQAALERLRAAQRAADKQRHEQLRNGVADALQRARRLAAEQHDITADVRSLREQAQGRSARVLELQERKWRMAEETRELETNLDRLSANARGQHGAGERALRDATRSMREQRLPERIERSASTLEDLKPESLQRLEAEIGADLDKLSSAIAVAADAINESGEQQARGFESMRELVRGLESLQERMARRAGGPRKADAGAQSSATNGRAQSSPSGATTGSRLDAEDIAEFQREFAGRRADLQALATDLDRKRRGAQNIDELVSKLRELERSDIYRDPQALLERQAALIAALKEMEFLLRQDARKSEARAPLLSGNDEVPVEFRPLVEEYFRDLARTDGK